MKTLKHFINGHYVAGSSEDSFELVSPVDGETYAISPNANEAEVEQAYSAAEAAFSIEKIDAGTAAKGVIAAGR